MRDNMPRNCVGKVLHYNLSILGLPILWVNISNPFCDLFSSSPAHVIEEVHKAEKGVDHLISTRQQWSSCLLSHHITWHLTLFYFGNNISTQSLFT